MARLRLPQILKRVILRQILRQILRTHPPSQNCTNPQHSFCAICGNAPNWNISIDFCSNLEYYIITKRK
nr:MAG TPA: dehydrogenase accessory protein [Caudoviricetes sp.]